MTLPNVQTKSRAGSDWRSRVRRRLTDAGLQELLLTGWALLALFFLLAPLLVVFINSVGTERGVVFPPKGLTLHWYTQIPATFVRSFWFSVRLGLIATVAGCFLGVTGAIGIVRGNFFGRAFLDSILRSPLHVPLLVAGIAFLQFYGAIYRATGWQLLNTTTGMAVAHIAAVTPYVLTSVAARLAHFDQSVEEAAYGLGASRTRTFFLITLPIIRPAIFAGALFAFIMSFDNVPLSIFLIGSKTMTFPIQLYQSMEFDLSRINYAVASVATIIFTSVILLVERLIGLRSTLPSQSS